MTFDERLVLIAKWLVALVLFLGIIMPVQIIWFLIFPFIIMPIRRKIYKETANQTELNFFTPVELYGHFAKKFLGLDEF